MEIYQVKTGDSLVAIARDVLGDQYAWRKIAQLNNIASPYIIRPGQQLIMPDTTVPGPVVVPAGQVGPPAPTRAPTRAPTPLFAGLDISPQTLAYLALGAAFLFIALGRKK